MLKLYKAEDVNHFDYSMRKKYALESLDLIKSAASLAFLEIKEEVRDKNSLILVGSGNNGADGIALYLLMKKEGFRVKVFYTHEAKSEENKTLRKEIALEDIERDIECYDCYIDSVFGASFHPPLKEDIKALFDEINKKDVLRISLDVPSAYYFDANETITFTALKEEQFSLPYTSGKIILRNPGFNLSELESYESTSYLLEDSDYRVKPFKESDYKNKRGHLLLKAGSKEFKGAAILSAKAAFHAGAGLVTLNTNSLLDASYYYPPIIVKEEVDYSSYDALLAGSGWGEDRDRSFLDFPKNMVLDADALLTLKKGEDLKGRAVLTPHIGEAKKLAERLGVENNAKEIAKALNAIVVKKSGIVEISEGVNTYYYIGNNPSLGVAGSGDVLSGIIGALLAYGLTPLDAAINGVILHQRSGRAAKEKYGFFDSLDLINEIGRIR